MKLNEEGWVFPLNVPTHTDGHLVESHLPIALPRFVQKEEARNRLL